MAKPIIAWSFSALEMFENCARKFWAVKIQKLVSDANQYNSRGDAEHLEFEHYLKKGIQLSPHMQRFQPMLDKLKGLPGEKYFEYQMTLTNEFIPTTWKDYQNAWVRAASDFLNVNGSKAHYMDWKSGKFRPKDDQIELSALLIFRLFPNVQQVNGGLVFYNHGKIHPHIIKREDESLLWNKFIMRVRALEHAKANDEWPANPNPLCGWCPYAACPHNTNKDATKGTTL